MQIFCYFRDLDGIDYEIELTASAMRLVLLGCSLAWACAVGAEQLLTGAGDASLPSGVSEATTDTDTDRVNPNADQRSTAQPTTGRRRRKSKTTLAEIVGLRSAQARDAPRRP
eukprot:6201471-Pleurochrysis_carterae.AAC.1